MIPLEKKESVKKEYREWFEANHGDLQADFNKYLEGGSKDWIKQTYREAIQGFLFKTSHDKCVYCERIPNEGGGNLEIEHFYPKKSEAHREKTFDFDNLLPSCEQCNNAKGTKYQTQAGDEIINPYRHLTLTPHLELDMATMNVNGVSPAGKATVEILKKSLNSKLFPLEGKYYRGALFNRLNIQKDIRFKLRCVKGHPDMEMVFEQLRDLLDVETKSCTATRVTILLTEPLFAECLQLLREKDQANYDRLRSKIKEKEKYCLAAGANLTSD